VGQLFLKKVRKSYGHFEVIKGVDLEVNDGEFVVFVGPSGCGKSTLLRMIAGLDDTTDGDIVIDGERVVQQDVVIGQSDGFLVEVVQGLNEGDQLVRHPDNRLDDGVRVRARL